MSEVTCQRVSIPPSMSGNNRPFGLRFLIKFGYHAALIKERFGTTIQPLSRLLGTLQTLNREKDHVSR